MSNTTLGATTISLSNITEWNSSPPKTSTYSDSITLLIEVLAFSLIDVIGFIGNGLVIAVVTLNSTMRTSANFFILSLSVADILVSLLVTPMVTLSRWKRDWVLTSGACIMQAFVNHATLFASLFSLATISVDRVVVTRVPGKYHTLCSKSLVCLYIAITWFFAILYAAFPIMGWGAYTFDYKRWNCIFSRKAAPSYSLFFASCCVILPLSVSAVAYFIIWVTFAKSRRTLRQFPGAFISGASEAKLTKNLFVVWLAFFICWLPMNILLFVDPKGLLDERVYTMAVWFLLCNSCVNPIIYGVQNKHYRKGYLKIISRLQCCRPSHNRIQPQLSLPLSSGSRGIVSPGNLNSSDTKATNIPKSSTRPSNSSSRRDGFNLTLAGGQRF